MHAIRPSPDRESYGQEACYVDATARSLFGRFGLIITLLESFLDQAQADQENSKSLTIRVLSAAVASEKALLTGESSSYLSEVKMTPLHNDATELLRLEALFGGESIVFGPKPLWERMNVAVGGKVRPDELHGLTVVRHADKISDSGELIEQWELMSGRKLWYSICNGWGYHHPNSPDFPNATAPAASPESGKPDASALVQILNARGEKEELDLSIGYIRRTFLSRKDLCVFALNLFPRVHREGPVEVRDVPPAIWNEFLEVLDIVKKEKVSVKQAVLDARERKKAEAPLSMRELLTQMGKHLYKDFSFDVPEDIRHLQVPKGENHTNNRSTARTLFDLLDYCESKNIQEFTSDHAEDFFATLVQKYKPNTNSSKHILIRGITGAYKWAKGSDGEEGIWKKKNPFSALEKKLRQNYQDELDDQEPEPHEIEEIKRLLAVAWEVDPAMAIAIAWSLFIGFRRCESLRCEGGTFEQVEESGLRAKLRKRVAKKRTGARVAKMPQSGVEWAALRPNAGKDKKFISFTPSNYAIRLNVIRKLAGIEPWGKDGLRKNYSIYTLIIGQTPKERKANLGHSERSSTTKDHYDGDAPLPWALAYEKLTPLAVLGYQPKPLTAEQMAAPPDRFRRRKFLAKQAQLKVTAAASSAQAISSQPL